MANRLEKSIHDRLKRRQRKSLVEQGRLKYVSYADDLRHTAIVDEEFYFQKGRWGVYSRILNNVEGEK